MTILAISAPFTAGMLLLLARDPDVRAAAVVVVGQILVSAQLAALLVLAGAGPSAWITASWLVAFALLVMSIALNGGRRGLPPPGGDGDDDEDGGLGCPPHRGGPPPPDGGAEPEWWPEFERDFEAYVRATRSCREEAAPSLRAARQCIPPPAGRRVPSEG